MTTERALFRAKHHASASAAAAKVAHRTGKPVAAVLDDATKAAKSTPTKAALAAAFHRGVRKAKRAQAAKLPSKPVDVTVRLDPQQYEDLRKEALTLGFRPKGWARTLLVGAISECPDARERESEELRQWEGKHRRHTRRGIDPEALVGQSSRTLAQGSTLARAVDLLTAAKLIRDAAAVLGIAPQDFADRWLADYASNLDASDPNGELEAWLDGRVRGFRFADKREQAAARRRYEARCASAAA